MPPALGRIFSQTGLLSIGTGCPGGVALPGDVQEMTGCDTECCGLVDEVVVSQRLNLVILESSNLNDLVCDLASATGPSWLALSQTFLFLPYFSHSGIMMSFQLKLENYATIN